MYKCEQLISAIKLSCLTCLVGLLSIGLVQAATFTVGSSADSHDQISGDGKCQDSLSRCTLRAAVEEANAYTVTKGDTILFGGNLNYQTITLNSSYNDINITSNIVIDATGMVLSVSGNNVIRIFEISGNNSVTLRGFTIRNGFNEYHLYGGGIRAVNRSLTLENMKLLNNHAERGAGLYRDEGLYYLPQTTTIQNSTFDGNDASVAGGGAHFGGIGTYSISGSTFSNNTCTVGCGFVVSDATLTMVNSTITKNAAYKNWDGYGSGIYIVTYNESSSGMKTLRNVTIAGNSSLYGSGIARTHSNANNLTLANTIIANPFPTVGCVDVCGSVISMGNNLIRYRSQSSGYIDSDLPDGTEPILGSLQYNGGTTKTLALLTGSPAIDAGNNLEALDTNNSTPLTTDQRDIGYSRILNSIVDIGAYESSVP
jgi:hypothetical protein